MAPVLGAVFFSLSSWALALIIFGVVAAVARRGCAAGSPSARASRDVARALRGGAGRAPRRGRSDPRVRPDPRRRPVRGSAGCGRRGRECDRNDVSAGSTPGRAGPDALARAAPRLHRPCAPDVARGSEQPGDATDDRPGGRRAAAAVGPGRPGARRRPDRVRAAVVRRRSERHDRSADRPHLGAQQPRTGIGARARGDRRGGRARTARPLSLGARAAACGR